MKRNHFRLYIYLIMFTSMSILINLDEIETQISKIILGLLAGALASIAIEFAWFYNNNENNKQ